MADFMEWLWVVATVAGPVLLAAALIFGTMHYRKRRRGGTFSTTAGEGTIPAREEGLDRSAADVRRHGHSH